MPSNGHVLTLLFALAYAGCAEDHRPLKSQLKKVVRHVHVRPCRIFAELLSVLDSSGGFQSSGFGESYSLTNPIINTKCVGACLSRACALREALWRAERSKCTGERGQASHRIQMADRADSSVKYAVLVDAENAQYTTLAAIMEEIATQGADAGIRRVYGDFTQGHLAPWTSVSLQLSFKMHLAPSYTSRKGSADAALIIDAMKLLHDDSVDGFALVSSDSDFTPLAKELREAGKSVIGFGHKKTPNSFVVACQKFVYVENLHLSAPPTNSVKQPMTTLHASNGNTSGYTSEALFNLVNRVLDEAGDEDGWLELSKLGKMLVALKSDFDVRSHGYDKLSTVFVENPKNFELKGAARKFSVRRTGRAASKMVRQIKAMQRSEPTSREKWVAYCNNQGSAIYDPAKHHDRFLRKFLYGPDGGLRDGSVGHQSSPPAHANKADVAYSEDGTSVEDDAQEPLIEEPSMEEPPIDLPEVLLVEEPAMESPVVEGFAHLTVAELKDELRTRGLRVTGNKPVLIERLQGASNYYY